MTFVVTLFVLTVITVATVFILNTIHEDGAPLPQEGNHRVYSY